MKNNLTELVFILDRSGSMSGLEKDTIGGYNGFIKKQKSEDGEVIMSTVLFDNEVEFLHSRVNIKNIKPITGREYFVRGSTALYDAIGMSIDAIGRKLAETIESERPSKVLFVITTDGMENASREYNAAGVKKMIKHQTDIYGWEFIFMGANIDAVSVAQDMGISTDMAVEFCNDSIGVEQNYAAVCEAVSQIRENKPLSKKWKQEIEADFAERSKKTKPE